MYYGNSQHSDRNLIKAWQVLLLLVCSFISWQMFNSYSEAHATVIEGPVAKSEIATAVANTAPAVEPERTRPRFLQIVATNDKVAYNSKDLFCLAKNIYHEARSEPVLGRYAVAQVTLNRMESDLYPDTVCSVVLQNKQFSWANNHSVRWTTPSGPSWEESKRIARDVLENGKRIYGLDEALFYHATYVRPYWARTKDRVTRIGLHIFYEV